MRRIAFLPAAFDDLSRWATSNKRVHTRIVKLVKDIVRDPFRGPGKPEPLKHDLAGLWSRRITGEN